MVPEGEKAVLAFDYNGDKQEFTIRFLEESSRPSEGKVSQIRFSGEDDKLNLTFVNFNSAIGMSSGKEVIEVGTSDNGETISILAYVVKSGGVYKVDIQTMSGGQNDTK